MPLINCTNTSCLCDATDPARDYTFPPLSRNVERVFNETASLGACARHNRYLFPFSTCAVKNPYCTSDRTGNAPVLTTGLSLTNDQVNAHNTTVLTAAHSTTLCTVHTTLS